MPNSMGQESLVEKLWNDSRHLLIASSGLALYGIAYAVNEVVIRSQKASFERRGIPYEKGKREDINPDTFWDCLPVYYPVKKETKLKRIK